MGLKLGATGGCICHRTSVLLYDLGDVASAADSPQYNYRDV